MDSEICRKGNCNAKPYHFDCQLDASGKAGWKQNLYALRSSC
jgi:hypothetical protein